MSETNNEPTASGPSKSPNGEIDPAGLVTEDLTTRDALGRIRRPGPYTCVPNYVLTERRLRPCSTAARYLFTVGWIYCNQARTDGQITLDDLRSLAASMKITEAEATGAAHELTLAGLWAPGYRVIDFTVWNLIKGEIEARAAAARDRMRTLRKGFPAPLPNQKATEDNRRQQEPSIERSIERDVPKGTDEPADAPETIKERQESARRLREISEEKLHLPAGSVS